MDYAYLARYNAPFRDLGDIELSNVLSVFVEGLPTSLVGAYGANTAETPCIDEIAAQGLVLDQCFADSINLQEQLASLWTARHALQPSRDDDWTLWSSLESQDIEACLLTDSTVAAEVAKALGCSEVIMLPPDNHAAPVEEISRCAMSRLFAAAAEELSSGRGGLIWIHSSGLRLPWDVPVNVRKKFKDPDDPDPPEEIGPPDITIDQNTDPDLITGWGQVAAAQASIADELVGILRDIVRSRINEDFGWLIGSLGAVSLGEDSSLGFPSASSHSERYRGVSIVQPAAHAPVGRRLSELFQLPDLCNTVLEMLGLRDSTGASWGRSILGSEFGNATDLWPKANQLAAAKTDELQWIRCPAWSAVLDKNQTTQLFVKPDDRWEVTDVASRRPDIVDQLVECWHAFEMSTQSGERGSWADLSDELTNLLR